MAPKEMGVKEELFRNLIVSMDSMGTTNSGLPAVVLDFMPNGYETSREGIMRLLRDLQAGRVDLAKLDNTLIITDGSDLFAVESTTTDYVFLPSQIQIAGGHSRSVRHSAEARFVLRRGLPTSRAILSSRRHGNFHNRSGRWKGFACSSSGQIATESFVQSQTSQARFFEHTFKLRHSPCRFPKFSPLTSSATCSGWSLLAFFA